MLLNCLATVVEFSLELLVLLLDFDVLLLEVGDFLVLDGGLIFETLVLDLNVALDLGDVLFGLFLGVKFEIG